MKNESSILKLIKLSDQLDLVGEYKFASMIDFMIKLAGYEDQWKQKIEGYGKGNKYPFSSWFGGQKRIFIPLGKVEEDDIEVDADVEGVLYDANCKVTDYVGGYCEIAGRKMRIGKLLQKKMKEGLKEVAKYMEEGSATQEDYESAEKFWKETISTFNNSKSRSHFKKRTNLLVVISQDIHDIAKMSYDRAWESCMTLGTGTEHKDVFCEVKEGAFIAYVIRSEDKDIESPIARLLVRHFKNSEGMSIAMPEDEVYGDEVLGFKSVVKSWINEKQGQIMPGLYNRKGGEYSDSLSEQEVVLPEDPEEILNWIKNIKDIPGVIRESWYVKDGLAELYGEYEGEEKVYEYNFDTKEEALKFMQTGTPFDSEMWEYFDDDPDIIGENFKRWGDGPHKETTDNSKTIYRKLFHKIITADKGVYPIEVIKKIRDSAPTLKDMEALKGLSSKYPELITEEYFSKINSFSKMTIFRYLPSDASEQMNLFSDIVYRDIIDFMSKDDLLSPIIKEFNLQQEEVPENMMRQAIVSLQNQISDLLAPIALINKKMPDELAMKISDFATDKIFDIGFEGKRAGSLQAAILSKLNKNNTNIEILKDFYRQMLDYYNVFSTSYNDVTVNTLGRYIGKLGEEGKEFLPIMEKFKQQVHNQTEIPNQSRRPGITQYIMDWRILQESILREYNIIIHKIE